MCPLKAKYKVSKLAVIWLARHGTPQHSIFEILEKYWNPTEAPPAGSHERKQSYVIAGGGACSERPCFCFLAFICTDVRWGEGEGQNGGGRGYSDTVAGWRNLVMWPLSQNLPSWWCHQHLRARTTPPPPTHTHPFLFLQRVFVTPNPESSTSVNRNADCCLWPACYSVFTSQKTPGFHW